MSDEKKNKNMMLVGGLIVILAIILTIIFVILNNGKTNDVFITGGGKVVGLRCENDTLTHLTLTDYKPLSFTNQITANFQNDELTSIMYQYEGVYRSSEEVRDAEAFAAADYNMILARDYGEDIEIFSHVFIKDGDKLRLTITGNADKVSSKTAPYFLLDQDKTFPKQIDKTKKAYEDKGFACKIIE